MITKQLKKGDKVRIIGTTSVLTVTDTEWMDDGEYCFVIERKCGIKVEQLELVTN